jgi:exopolyphosphatase / guanosine-5'-triphosphate,3'-diphosphate pyrophosphatase
MKASFRLSMPPRAKHRLRTLEFNFMDSTEKPERAKEAKTVAAIDVGANALRMVIAEVLPDGQIEVIERAQRAARLGQDTFRRGRLGAASMRVALAILRDFRVLLSLYKVEEVRAVATSAAREASNTDTFLDRIYLTTGIKVEVIGTPEESRLTVSAVRKALGGALNVNRGDALIVDVGGGSTLLTLLQDGEIVTSQSLRLGSVRLHEVLATSEDSPEQTAEVLRYQISTMMGAVQNSIPLNEVESFIAVGGDARFAVRQIGRPTDSPDLFLIDPVEFDQLVDRCERWTAEELARRFGVPFAEAETINPALLVYQQLFRLTKARQIIVSQVTMRDGLLLELANHVTGKEDEALVAGVVHSALAVARKYHVDLDHAQTVADVALRLFDEIRPDHGMSRRQRLILHVAALLHEVGGYVSNRSHHKHSYYLIANSEIFGLNREETVLAAHVARYHRRSGPKPSHPEYMSLPRESRVLVNKLAAIIRVADALSRGHVHAPCNLRFERQGDDLIVCVPNASDLLLEQRAVHAKADLFEDIYGMKIRLELT